MVVGYVFDYPFTDYATALYVYALYVLILFVPWSLAFTCIHIKLI